MQELWMEHFQARAPYLASLYISSSPNRGTDFSPSKNKAFDLSFQLHLTQLQSTSSHIQRKVSSVVKIKALNYYTSLTVELGSPVYKHIVLHKLTQGTAEATSNLLLTTWKLLNEVDFNTV